MKFKNLTKRQWIYAGGVLFGIMATILIYNWFFPPQIIYAGIPKEEVRMILKVQENRHKKVIKDSMIKLDAADDKISKLTSDARKMRKSVKTQINSLPEHPVVKELGEFSFSDKIIIFNDLKID